MANKQGYSMPLIILSPYTAPKSSSAYDTLFPSDPYSSLVSSYISYDSLPFTDSATGTSVRAVGSIPIVNGAAYFNGNTGNYIDVTSPTAFNFGTADFTWETWVTTKTLAGALFDFRRPGVATGPYPVIGHVPSYGFQVFNNGTNTIMNASLTANKWQHVAFVRYNGVFSLYIDGINRWNAPLGAIGSTGLFIGSNGFASGGADPWSGYYDDTRITKGVARYIANFDTAIATPAGKDYKTRPV